MERLDSDEYYIGSACNPKYRLIQHNNGNVKATKNKKPYKLVFTQGFNSLDAAKKVERKLKGWKRKDFIKKIIEDGKIRSN